MKELLILMSAAIPMTDLVDMLEKEINNYKESGTEEALSKLQMTCLLMTSKHAVSNEGKGDDMKGATSIIGKMDLHDKAYKLLDTTEQ